MVINLRLFISLQILYVFLIYLLFLENTFENSIYTFWYVLLLLSITLTKLSKLNLLCFYTSFYILLVYLNVHYNYLWQSGAFFEQDTYILYNNFESISLNPLKNWSNGGFYASLVLFFFSIIDDFIISALTVNYLSGFILLLIITKINYSKKNYGLVISYVLLSSPSFWVYSQVILKDFILMFAFFYFFIYRIITNINKLKKSNYVLGIFYFYTERLFLIPIYLMNCIRIKTLHIAVLPLLLTLSFYLANDFLQYVFTLLKSGISKTSVYDMFPLSILKFTYTPYIGNSTLNFPCKIFSNFHWLTTTIGIIGFLFYTFKLNRKVFFTISLTYILISCYAPGYDRFRLMFEPCFAVGTTFILSRLRQII